MGAGVILIKTKTGKSKKGLGIEVNSNAVLETLLTLPVYQNAFGQGSEGKFSYVDGAGKGINDGVDESWGPKMDGRLIPQFFSKGVAVPFVAHPDNVRDFFQTGYSLNNSISVADAGEKYDYRISYNNLKQVGIVPNSGQGKNSFVLNTSLKITPKLTLTANANYSKLSSDNLPGTGGSRSTTGDYTPVPRSAAEAEFLAIGAGARTWLVEAAAAGTSRIGQKSTTAR